MAKKVENPVTGEDYDLTDPGSLLRKVAGGIVALTIMLWSVATAQNRGVPMLNAALSTIPGVDLTSTNESNSGDGILGEF